MTANHEIDIDQAARIFRSVFGTATSEARQNVVDAVDRYANELGRECDEATEAESFEFLNELALAFRAAENHPRPQCAPVLEGIRAVLAHLHSTDRLIPAGGMALTAEQVEDVEALVAAANPYSAPAARLRALFPATEPAEPAASEGVNCGANSVTLGWCKLTARHEGLHTNGTYFWGQAPTPAEPAEDIRGLIEKSSLGTESAQALISTVSPEHGRRVAQEAARREAGTKVKLTELQRDLLQRIVDQWTKGAGWTHVFWSGTVEALISAGCIVRHEEAFNEYRPTIFGEKALTPAEPAEEETKAERDSEGIIRINGGRIVALSCDTREMVQRWFDLAEPGSKWQRDYAAALDLFDREAASSPVVPAPTETGPWA